MHMSNNRSLYDQIFFLHVLVLNQFHNHVHFLDLLSSIRSTVAGTDDGTVDWRVEVDKIGEGLLVYKLLVHIFEEGQGHCYSSNSTASGSSWLAFDAFERWVEGLLPDSEILDCLCWPLHLQFQCLKNLFLQWSLVLLRWHVERDAHLAALWQILLMLCWSFHDTCCGLCGCVFWTLYLFVRCL